MVHKATARYLKNYIEPNLPTPPAGFGPWKNVLVVPVYNESPEYLGTLNDFLVSQERALVILIVNAPESKLSVAENNEFLSNAIRTASILNQSTYILSSQSNNIFIYNLDNTDISIPDNQGVGLARKIGCDLAVSWHDLKMIESHWIANSDADAILPSDYFERINQLSSNYVAATFPFKHISNSNLEVTEATQLYELSMHYYVVGLEYANSPYAYHTIGSCIAISMQAYTEVGGIPKRSGGEDFHLLNKVAKTGKIKLLTGATIKIQSRKSDRVPFGTGPAVSALLLVGEEKKLFYQPQCFVAIKQLLRVIPELYTSQQSEITKLLYNTGLEKTLSKTVVLEMNNAGIDKIIEHCREQASSSEQFYKHFTHWFDALKTLKLIHAIRDAGMPMLSLKELTELSAEPFEFLPNSLTATAINSELRKQWGWF